MGSLRVGRPRSRRARLSNIPAPSWPGLVDTHIHGFHNHATTDCDPAAIDDASVALAKSGTTTWLPTTFTESVEDIGRACAAIAQADEARSEDYAGAHIGGIFLEGPFFTTAHVGAQNPKFLIDPTVEVFDRLAGAGRRSHREERACG